ncbi:c-type cytochrome [Paralimibaculum aggregatum]|uniref:c-type cytochrome n=1 Tax=Paralimibaculum aggregatum TaxID=3036245 RepID=UPI0025538F2F|nr:cytochrome c [Limibaculum sp. NKW23]
MLILLGWSTGMHRHWPGGMHHQRMDRADTARTSGEAPPPETVVPALSADARAGETAFGRACAACHGQHAAGVDGAGPPLVHVIYEPGHHADFAFLRAIRQGVRAHHWRFGDMPAIAGVSDAEAASIIAYVRELQRANGID